MAPRGTPPGPCPRPSFLPPRPRHNSDICERAIMIVVIDDAGRAVASHKNIRPAVVVVVEPGNAAAAGPVGLFDFSFPANVSSHSVASILIYDSVLPRAPARATG